MTRFLIILLFFIFSCNSSENNKKTIKIEHPNSYVDVHSFAQPDSAKIKHLSLSVNVDFEASIIRGVAAYNIINYGTDEIHFDFSEMDIEKVYIDHPDKRNKLKQVKFIINLGNEFGNELVVPINEFTNTVHIVYKTHPDSRALQWLNPEQTYDKTFPFLYTQGQAILTRSWIPIQDSPGIRVSYDATIQVPGGMMALMSAENPREKDQFGNYTFKQTMAIPPYLIALAVGDIEYQKLSDRTGVYAEPGLLDAAAFEFSEMDSMLNIAEELVGQYKWGVYEVLILPPSFPFGGMENPRLTFGTPTIIAGDKSLTTLIAHEMAHSWSGNLVTNATWDDFWLNEGFTVYIEQRIMEGLYGKEYANMIASIGYEDLEKEMATLDSADTHLKLDLTGRNPDDGMTDVAYEKGSYFLKEIEKTVGRKKFDAFLKQYFIDFENKSLTTEDFLNYLDEKLLVPEGKEVNVEAWVYSPELPAGFKPEPSTKFLAVEMIIAEWVNGTPISNEQTADWSTFEWLHFLRFLPQELNQDQMIELDDQFHFTESTNSEIQAEWYTISIRNQYHVPDPYIEVFLTRVGRRKFLSPLYEEMIKTPEGKQWAKKIYIKARANYHFVSVNTLDELLDVKRSSIEL
jgi:aminopeptidase N